MSTKTISELYADWNASVELPSRQAAFCAGHFLACKGMMTILKRAYDAIPEEAKINDPDILLDIEDEIGYLQEAVENNSDFSVLSQASCMQSTEQVAENLRQQLTEATGRLTSKKSSVVEERVCEEIMKRRKVGLAKYGVGLERNDLTLMDWLQHAKEEAMDFSLYLERIKIKLEEDSK